MNLRTARQKHELALYHGWRASGKCDSFCRRISSIAFYRMFVEWNIHCFQLSTCIQIFGTPTTELAKILDKLNGNIIYASSFRTISQQGKINNLKKCNRELIIKSLNQFNWRKAQYLPSPSESWENKLVETCQNNDAGNEELILTSVCSSNTTDASDVTTRRLISCCWPAYCGVFFLS